MRKKLLRITIVIILILGVFVSVPLILSVLNKGQITAGIHKIEKAAPPYLYKYHSSTFELLAGEKEDKPRFILIQGKRNLDIKITPAKQTPPPKPKPFQPEPTQESEENEPTPSTEPEPEPQIEGPTTPDENNHDDSSFLPTGTVVAGGPINVINETTKPTIEYNNGASTSDVLLTPNQEKVGLTFEIESPPKQLPSLSISPKKLSPGQRGNEIIFATRTNREAFSLKNATIRDKSGAKTNVNLVLKSTSNTDYNISFSINGGWLSDKNRAYPLTLSLDSVSLFHDRLIDAAPVKADFAATERPEFIIDPTNVDEPLKSALLNRDYSNLKFGSIDSNGKGRQLPAELYFSGGNLILRFNNSGTYIRPGLFDLLVQYQDEPSHIGEEEFSWGVLAMNPDQAVYKPGQEANIDMAVLNERGNVVCDANLVLEITDPTGNTSTKSTSDGSIEITSGCFLLETELPDYTTKYKTSAAGTYNIRLTATTENGSYTITDKFTADPDSPFYVKRTGPTRIFPPKTYTMNLSIEANQNASKIIETVPNNFTVDTSPEFSLSQSGKKTITWNKEIKKGDIVDLSYKFKGPEISPALFFVGPMQIGSWKEPRVWQIASDAIAFVDAANNAARNTTTVTISGWTATSGNLLVVICSSDVNSINFANPSEGGYTSILNTQSANGSMETFFKQSDGTETAATCSYTGSNSDVFGIVLEYSGVDTSAASASLGANGSGDATAECPSITPSGNNVYIAGVTFLNANTAAPALSWASDVFAERVDAQLGAGPGSGRENYGAADYYTYSGTHQTQVTHSGGGSYSWVCQTISFNESTGPTNAQLMRHGKWFDGSATPEQPMTF
jgi:hypothetical protein